MLVVPSTKGQLLFVTTRRGTTGDMVQRHLIRYYSMHIGVRLENGIYGHSRFCNTDFDDKLACLNLSGV